MKPRIDNKKCGASESACTVLKKCPTNAISYIEVDEAITDKTVNCKSESGCGCSCDCGDSSVSCEPNPYGRIIIEYDKCNGCGICADICCGSAIEMV